MGKSVTSRLERHRKSQGKEAVGGIVRMCRETVSLGWKDRIMLESKDLRWQVKKIIIVG